MPRPNKQRLIGAEVNLALRMREERERRGWSYERLAQEMTDAGCPIQGSAVYKIEKGDPPRRITVDELAAMSRIWAIPTERLMGGA